MNTEPILRVQDVSVRFGGISALSHVSFSVERGEICGIIGPNGAGKTTLFNCLNKLYRMNGGDIVFDGMSLLKMPRHRMAAAGLGRTFQNLALFRSMSVRQNVLIGGHCCSKGSFLSDAFRIRSVRSSERVVREQADALIDALDLQDVADNLVGNLSFAVQKRVELARALLSQPKLLLLDEPAAGLNFEEAEQFCKSTLEMRTKFKLTILIVEHHMNLVMRLSDKIIVLNFGRLIAQGTPAEVSSNPDVISAYLGATA